MGPSDVRKHLIFIINEVDSLANIEQVVKMSDSDVAAFKLWFRNKVPSSSILSRVRGQKPPTSHRFTLNTEIDGHHDRDAEVAAKYLKLSGPILKLSRTNLTAPVSMTSGASIDELSEILLEPLLDLESSNGLKILLTVVRPAYLFSAVTAIVADSSGQHVRIALYNSSATNLSQAQQIFPIGAQFYLKQPFLKRCADQWLGLRVDDPATLVRLDVPLHGHILVVGDGDLSFSCALERRNAHFGAVARITASTLDSKETVTAKYDKGYSNLEYLSRHDSCTTVLHEVDATNLQSSISTQLSKIENKQTKPFFKTVVWNFPYAVGSQFESQPSNSNSVLIGKFLLSVKEVLDDNGQVRITLASRQGGTSREARAKNPSWNIEEIAKESGFDLIEVFPFVETMYPGYEPKREFVDKSFPYQNAQVHMFKRIIMSKAKTQRISRLQ